MKRLFAFLLAVLMITSIVPITRASAASQSGACGENVTWLLDDAGTLTISGTGPMRKYTFLDLPPWHSQRASVKSVVVENGVTTISGFAFYDSIGLISATIADSVTSIGDAAFQDCIGLTSVAVGEGVTTIGSQAFDGCSSLSHITLPDSVTSIGHKAFKDCTNLTSITLGAGLTHINSYGFFNCASLKSVTIPNEVTNIESNAFAYCYALESVDLPDNLTKIGSDAFNCCISLTNVCIPDNVRTIELRAFYECKSLVSVTLPDKLTKIEDKAFYLSKSLKSIVFPEGVTQIGDRAFNSGGLETVWFPLSLKDGGDDAFVGCPMKDVYYPGSSKQFRSINFGPRSSDDFRDNATFHFGIPDLVTPSASLVNNPQTGLQELIWEPIEDAVRYEIYRATSTNGPFTLVYDGTETVWRDPSGTLGKTYYYQAKAIHEDPDRSSGLSQLVVVKYVCGSPVVSITNDSKGKPAISWSKVSGAKKYTVYRATSETGKYSKLGTTTKLTYTDSKAKAGTTYFYKVIANASSSKYNSGYSNIVSCGVICGTPSVTVKIDANTGKPSLSWKKVDGAAKYAIYRDGELLAEQTAVTYADTGAAIDTQYTYTVQALGKTEDLNGNPSKAVTATSGIAKPAAKGSIDAVSGKPVITWAAVEGAVKYEVYRSTKSNKSYSLVATVEELTYTDTSVSAGKTYYYQVKAIGEVSKSANSSYVKLTGKCATPAITVESNAKAQPVISWEKVSGAKKYTVYRSTSETSGYKSIGTSKTTSYTDTKATPGKVYYYKVIANASSSKYNSGYSNIVSCGVNCATPVVKVSNNANGKTVLTWSKVTGATKYEIYRLVAEDYVTLATVTGTTWTDADGVVGDERYYGVRAIASAAEFSSEVSDAVFGKAIPATPKVSGKVGANKKPVLTWGEVEGATKYIVYRSTSKSKNYKIIGESEVLTYEDLTAAKGKTYYYKVVAVGEGVQSAQSSYAKVKSK